MPNVIRTRTIPGYIREAYLTQKRRREYPKSYFLKVVGGNRKFPYRDPKSGKVHCGLLRGAITRAAQYGYSDVEDKARRLYNKSCKMSKMELVKDDDSLKEGIVFGIVYEPGVVDAHGDEIIKEAIEQACWEYNVNFGNNFLSHGLPLSKDDMEVLESYVAPVDFEINGRVIKEGTWLMRCRVKNDEFRGMIAKGDVKGFSLGGVVLESESA